MVTGIKRKFVEILDSDDETATTCSDGGSEYKPDETDVLEDEIEDLKDDITEVEESNQVLVNLLIKERETIAALRAQLADSQQKYDYLISNVKEIQNTSWIEVVVFAFSMVVATGITAVSLYACHEVE
jgi:predicted RNase H-like nuclease (RuvC/YqgF family)